MDYAWENENGTFFQITTISKGSGFSVYCAKPIEVCDDNGRKTLSEYMSRAPFSLERMNFNENSKTVVYKGEHFHPTLARNFDVSDPLEWIARITSHIPKKGAKQVIYYGSYSQAWRGRERRQGFLPKAPNEEEPASMKDRSSYSRRIRQLRVVLLKKVWDIDVLKCPKGEVCPNVGGSRRSESFFIDGGGVQVVWSISGRNRRFYWDEYAISGKFPERFEIKIPIAE